MTSESNVPHRRILLWLGSFWGIVMIAVVLGYTFGKDMALRDNARDDARAASAEAR